MKILTICFGILLTLLGTVYYYLNGLAGFSTLLPALFGMLVVLFGLLQGRWKHKNPLYGAIMLAILTFLGSVRGIYNLLTGQSADSATLLHATMGVLAVVFVALGVVLIKNFWHGWQAFGQFLGNWLARVVLTVFYFTILVPFGLGVRLFSDPLCIKTQPAELWRPRATGDQKLEDVVRQF
jgi:hypothetical protein